MMRFRLSLLLALAAAAAHAQLPSDFRSEQVYLCPQTLEIPAGDSICVRGAVACLSTADGKPYSNYVYVELIDAHDSLLVRQKVSCKDGGLFSARLATDPLGDTGVYYLRAYTRLMLNFSNESLAVQPILVGRNFPKRESMVDDGVQCVVVPAGGTLSAGTLQSLTAYLTDYLGDPLPGHPLHLLTARGDTVASCHTSMSGMALFRFMPKLGEHYHVSFSDKGLHKEFRVPDAKTDMPKVQASLTGNKLRYEVLNVPEGLNPALNLFSYDRRNGLLHVHAPQRQGIIQLPESPELATLFLADRACQVVSECTALAVPKRAAVPVVADTVHAGEPISVTLPAGENASQRRLFVRLASNAERWSPRAERALVYESDFSSPIPFPSGYFDEGNRRRLEDLEAWIGTAHFKRFSLKDAVEKDTAVYVCQPEMVMHFEGCIDNDTRRQFRGGTLVAYNTANDLVYDAEIDNDGHFRIAVDDFSNGDEFFLQAINHKGKPVAAHLHLNDEVFPSTSLARHYSLKASRYADSAQVTFGDGDMRRHVLPNITVKARLRREQPKPTNKFYSTNYADREKIEQRNYLTLIDILRDMHGVVLSASESTTGSTIISLQTTRGASTLGGGSLPIILDGTKLPNEMITNTLEMSASDIEEVELLRPWQTLAYAQGCIGGAIMVKTRKSASPGEVPSKGTFYLPQGLSLATFGAQPLPKADREGTCRLLIDVIEGHTVCSYERTLVVVP